MMFKKTFKRIGAFVLTAAMVATSGIAVPAITAGAFASPTARNMEMLDRGIVAVKTDDGIFVMWRRLATESADTQFTLYRNKEVVAEGAITNFVDASGTLSDNYTVVCNNTMSKSVRPSEDNYIEIPCIEAPVSDSLSKNRDGIYYSVYYPSKSTYGDLDGDGEYEIIMLWSPPDAKDAASGGRTGRVFVDAYKMDGTFLWQIDMGWNIRAGSHDTMLSVADFDNDGEAELFFRTADGTMDAAGNYVGDPAKGAGSEPYENSWAAMNGGKNLRGPLYVTCFDGDGTIIDSTEFFVNNTEDQDVSYSFGDDFGNRSERYNATIAYLDGKTPSVVYPRGYYGGKGVTDSRGVGQRTTCAAYSLKNNKVVCEWKFDTSDPSVNTGGADYSAYTGQGNHQLEAADVDGDGFDEIVYGGLTWDQDGSILWCSGVGHGDAMHLGDFDPTNEGLEFMKVNEGWSGTAIKDNPLYGEWTKGIVDPEGRQNYGMVIQDAKTGKVLQTHNGVKDTGRGVIANIGYKDTYYVAWAAGSTGYWDNNGNKIENLSLSMNGRIFWDGDLQDELQDSANDAIKIEKYIDSTGERVTLENPESTYKINGTKANSNGQGDILGDWREEFITYTIVSESVRTEKMEIPANWDKTIVAEVDIPVKQYALRIYFTDIPTDYNFYTLAHDDVYRNSSAAYSNCYSQPPHISWYMNDHIQNSPYTTQPAANVNLVANNYKPTPFDASKLPEAGEAVDRPTTPTATKAPTVNLAPGEFTDTVNHWAKDYIKKMGVAGYVSGMGDGTFKPDATVTKGQFVKLIVAAMELPVGSAGSAHWAKPYVDTAKAANIVSKNIALSSNADYDTAITREEMASIVARAAEYKGLTADGTKSFTDSAQIASWAAEDIKTASGLGIINGYDDGTFKPKGNATRAESATMLSNFVGNHN